MTTSVDTRGTIRNHVVPVLGLALFVGPLPALASTPDSATPAVEDVCEDEPNNLKGLCNAYCEAMDCDSPSPSASDTGCASVFDNYLDRSGGEPPPCAEPQSCTPRLINGSFEDVNVINRPPATGFAPGAVPGWDAIVSSPDLFTSPLDVPSNFMGDQAPVDGLNYAGISTGRFRGVFLTEGFTGTLDPIADAQETCDVTGYFSQGDLRVPPGVNLELSLRDSLGLCPDVLVGHIDVNDMDNWQLFEEPVTVPAGCGYDKLVLIGWRDYANDYWGGYAYIDDLDVCCI